MPHHFFFYLGLSFILMHEMDAIRCKEWRIFPGLSLLDDRWGFGIFVLAHIPLFYFPLWQMFAKGNNESLIYGLNVFFIVHVFAHLLFLFHKKNEFRDWISWTIITGAGVFGLFDLLL
jgi:hypothetical protein